MGEHLHLEKCFYYKCKDIVSFNCIFSVTRLSLVAIDL